MKIGRVINFIVGIGLFILGMYTVFWITQKIDFANLQIIVNNSKELWKFLAFVPVIITLFAGALSIINGIINLKSLTIMNALICIGLIIFLKVDLYGFVTILPAYNGFANMLVWILIAVTVLLVVGLIISMAKERQLKSDKVNI